MFPIHLLITLVLLVPSVGQPAKSFVQPAYFKLAVRWPTSFCNDAKLKFQCSNSNPLPNRFTIHGLWGFEKNHHAVPDCEKYYGPAPALDKSELSVDELEFEWPSHTGPHFVFWQREWKKHGSCLASMTQTHGSCFTGMPRTEYFATSLDIMGQIGPLMDHLSQDGVVPSSTKQYSPQDFPRAVENQIGFVTEAKCNTLKGSSVQQIFEIHFCATRDGKLMDCPRKAPYKVVGCQGLVIFPPAKVDQPPITPPVLPSTPHPPMSNLASMFYSTVTVALYFLMG